MLGMGSSKSSGGSQSRLLRIQGCVSSCRAVGRRAGSLVRHCGAGVGCRAAGLQRVWERIVDLIWEGAVGGCLGQALRRGRRCGDG